MHNIYAQAPYSEFISIDFDFIINPDQFMEWLKYEDQIPEGDYSLDCSGMCEYSCLYIGMLLSNTEYIKDMTIHYGRIGMFEHFWIGYIFKGVKYIIDLTLQQFDKKVPKLSIAKADNPEVKKYYTSASEGTPLTEYLMEVKASEFYTDPSTLIIPEKAIELRTASNYLLDYSFESMSGSLDGVEF